MRLLNVHDLTLKDFNDSNRPPYAILSHTWGDGEVSFQDMQTPDVAASMAGYAKILKCCEVAKNDGFDYAWVDTCCIDKTSSAELSEAINSMFRWYSKAIVCYAFLSDVDDEGNHEERKSQFRESRWFRRGWTLQELLAPEVVVFFNSKWIDIGTKRSLRKTISKITNIPVEALLNTENYIEKSSIAERMSWAAARETTRVEDIAYSLMGIFNVNMPPLYGEGKQAFQRLQFEIMRFSQDESILAWNFPSYWSDLEPLAESPYYFGHCQVIIQKERPQTTPPFSITNRGLHIWLPGIRVHHPDGRTVLYAQLNCAHRQNDNSIFIGLSLPEDSKEWNRVNTHIYNAEHVATGPISESLTKETLDAPLELYVRKGSSTSSALSLRRCRYSGYTNFHFNSNMSPDTGYRIQYFCILKGSHPTEQFESSIPQNSLNCWSFPVAKTYSFFHSVHLVYCVVKSIRNPNVQTVVALRSARPWSTNIAHCRIFRGSDIPPSLIALAEFLKTGTDHNDFFQVFPHEETMVYPGEKFVEYLPKDDMKITVTIRVGPPIPMIYPDSFSNLHVHIAFGSTSS